MTHENATFFSKSTIFLIESKFFKKLGFLVGRKKSGYPGKLSLGEGPRTGDNKFNSVKYERMKQELNQI